MPASPIAAIIDQDAEKFRIYMNKLNSPNRRNVSAPIQAMGNKQDLASALGQAVAMENIQQQIDIQNQLMGQVLSTRIFYVCKRPPVMENPKSILTIEPFVC